LLLRLLAGPVADGRRGRKDIQLCLRVKHEPAVQAWLAFRPRLRLAVVLRGMRLSLVALLAEPSIRVIIGPESQ
jgi:hypothetical protein